MESKPTKPRISLKEILLVIVVLVLLLSIIYIGFVQQQPAIKSEREVGEAVTNISGDVEDVTQILEDIDTKIG